MEIELKEITKNKYIVKILSKKETEHIITISDKTHKELTNKKITKKKLLLFSINFLLEREMNTSILKSFELSTISKYFPEYDLKIKKYFNI